MEYILYKRLSDETIGACIEVHKLMGQNLSEKIYEACGLKELEKRGITQKDKNGSISFSKVKSLKKSTAGTFWLQTNVLLNLRQCQI